MFLSLFIICAVAAAVLAGVNELTKEPIANLKKIKLENAIQEVVSGFNNSPSDEAYWVKINDTDSLKIYPAKKDGKDIGAAIESNSMKGFSGEIKVIVGFDVEGKLLNYIVLQHAETPGLGDKMGDWFKQDKNNRNIIGRNLKEGVLRVSKDGGDVDAITAATITSRAFLDAVNRAYSVYLGNISDAESGATTASDAKSSATTSSDAESSATTASDAESAATTQVEKITKEETPKLVTPTNKTQEPATPSVKKTTPVTTTDAESGATTQTKASPDTIPDAKSSATTKSKSTPDTIPDAKSSATTKSTAIKPE